MPDSSETPSLYSPFDDPLFLSPTDQPSLVLSSFLFDGTSFLQWQREVVAALLSKNKSGFISGKCSLPAANGRKYNQWIRCDLLVKRWILNSIVPGLRENLQFAVSSKSLWVDIVERFGQPNILEVYELKKDLGRISQDNSPLVEYYGKLKNIWENLDHLDPIPSCTCGAMNQCSCQMLKRLVDRETQSKLLQLLMGLTSGYEHAQTNLLTMEPLPPINKALGLLQKVERQKHINDQAAEVSVEQAAFASKKRFNSKANEAGTANKRPKEDSDFGYKFCTHCEKAGHTIEECHRLKTCTFCKIKGHIQERCYKYKAFLKRKGKAGEHSSFQANNVEQLTEDQDSEYQDISPLECLPVSQQVFQDISDVPSSSSSDLKATINFVGMPLSSRVFTASLTGFNDHDWIVDTGASDHITSNIKLMNNVKILAKPVYVGLPDGTVKIVHKIGDVCLTDRITLHSVLLIPDFQQNLLSVAKLITAANLSVCFLKTKCVFQDHTSKAVAEAKRVGNLYRFRPCFIPLVQKHVSFCPNKDSYSYCQINATSIPDLALVHSRFGHSSLEKLQHVIGLNLKGIKQFHCETCVFGKHHVLPFLRSLSYAKRIFDLVHVDVWGPYKVPSLSGARSFLTVLDDHSRNTWTFLIQNKTQVPSFIKGFVAYVENQFSTSIKTIRSDNGSEFFQVQCKDFFRDKGIVHQRSIVGRPQQNGRVERKHRHLLEVARALKILSKAPIRFWGECVLTATYLINKMPVKLLGWKTPYELLFNELPSYDELRIFGTLCYATQPPTSTDKF
ncbi:uncharacterized protein LOC141631085 [Silene latifolia]|uniref:uncharacterized protein LOC141631085 n=1 Tax=Silene latifolia TaxID=37657 RepID=UPI003D7890D2